MYFLERVFQEQETNAEFLSLQMTDVEAGRT